MPSKYDALRDYLKGKMRGEFTLAFRDIEQILGFPLPKSAERPQWWANTRALAHPQTRSWHDAGFDAFLVSGSRKVRFRSH